MLEMVNCALCGGNTTKVKNCLLVTIISGAGTVYGYFVNLILRKPRMADPGPNKYVQKKVIVAPNVWDCPLNLSRELWLLLGRYWG